MTVDVLSSASEAGPSKSSTSPTPFETLTRPPFRPTTISPSGPCFLSSSGHQYIPTFSHPVHFTRANFFSALKDLTLHPERNSSLILRADPLPAREAVDDDEVLQAGLQRHEEIRVRLMPKQVKRDGRLDQRVSFYEDGAGRGVVLMVPEVRSVEDVPFYHPPVRKLAFIYEPMEQSEIGHQELTEDLLIRGTLSIAYLGFDGVGTGVKELNGISEVESASTPSFLGPRMVKSPRKRSPLAATPLGTSSDEPIKPPAVVLEPDTSTSMLPPKVKSQAETAVRTVRTCKLLLERVYKHAYGSMVGYQKRVVHDVVVNRETFQDLYLVLKERHRHLDSRVVNPHGSRVEDVKRHVWKISDTSLPSDPSLPDDISSWGSQDIAIATFLMLLWRDMYPAREPPKDEEEPNEWDKWGRPPAGFVDLGCGNGLLVHVLTSEGYAGKGYELRARKTWPGYPPRTREALVEKPISFPDWFPSTADEWESGNWEGKGDCPITEGCFIIGNHADEITPWIPLLSLIPRQPAPFLSLPCCLHTLDGPFTSNVFSPPPHSQIPEGGFDKGLEDGASRYKAYLMWLGWCGMMAGWMWEKEPLRIPSTKGWAIIGRKRWTNGHEDRESREWALEQVHAVRERGVFRVREKEGKDNH